jgi:spore germination protein
VGERSEGSAVRVVHLRAITADDRGHDRGHDLVDPSAVRPPADVVQPRRRGIRVAAGLLLVLCLVAAALAGALRMTHKGPFALAARAPLQLIASMPYWSMGADTPLVLGSNGHFAAITPWTFGITKDGTPVSLERPSDQEQDAQAMARMRAAGVPLIPTISNTLAGNWDYADIIAVLRDPGLRADHIGQIVQLATGSGFAGIDIDYEDFQSGDRSVFSAFVAELATALHRAGKTLSVDVFAKTTDAGYDVRNVAQDYEAIGRSADTVRIMAYDWHWASSEPGPIAPISWDHDVLKYALTQIPAAKISLGIPSYGYDWVGQKGQMVSWLQAYGLQQKYGAVVHWDSASQSPWLRYRSADGANHIVWFENAYSSLAKLALAHQMKIGSAYLWLVGDEDDLLWNRLSDKDVVQAAQNQPTSAP